MTEAPQSEIRQAEAGDAASVARLLHDFNTEYEDFTPGVPALTERLGELLAGKEIVALLAGEPALGFALLRIRPSLWAKANDAYLEELYVAPEHRRRGIGRRLLNVAMDAARKANANHFELTTGETDTEARALYESTGLTNREGGPDGPRMLYYEIDL
ncbi:MAG TPA: GNAT family N-acetyltransferase [Solirubrobacterales bacterium]|nr:GNAT family N-acetyltransferase [Solirubrobacterales bacterium]